MSRVERRPAGRAAHSCFAGRSTRCFHPLVDEADRGGLVLLEHGQGPAPAGQLAGDGDVGDHVPLAAGAERVPAVRAAAGCRHRRGPGPLVGRAPSDRAWSCPTGSGPGGARRPRPAADAAWVLPVLVIEPWTRDWPEEYSRGHEADERADGVAGEPVPVADLDRQREPGQGADPAQAAQSSHHRGELAVRGHGRDRRVEPVAACLDASARRRSRTRRSSAVAGRIEPLTAQPDVVGAGPGLTAGVDDALAQQELRQPMPGPHQVTAGSPHGPGPGPGRSPGPRSGPTPA